MGKKRGNEKKKENGLNATAPVSGNSLLGCYNMPLMAEYLNSLGREVAICADTNHDPRQQMTTTRLKDLKRLVADYFGESQGSPRAELRPVNVANTDHAESRLSQAM